MSWHLNAARAALGRRLGFESLESRRMLAIDFSLLKDINLATPAIDAGDPSQLTEVSGALYFLSSTSDSWGGLWRIEPGGSTAKLIKQLDYAGSLDRDLTNVNGTLYFFSINESGSVGLWKSDGTTAGTKSIKAIDTIPITISPRSMAHVGNEIYFAGRNGASGFELWKSDGTAAGTVLLKDIVSGTGSSSPSNFTVFGSTVYFTAGSTSDIDLWKTDGTAAGTVKVKELNTSNSSYPIPLIPVGSSLFFGYGGAIWATDGTEAGTLPVTGALAGSASEFVNVSGTLFFRTYTVASGKQELWKSDGTMAGTGVVRDTSLGIAGSKPTGLYNHQGTLYFAAVEESGGFELWKSDGTATGTVQVFDRPSGALFNTAYSTTQDPHFVSLGNTVFFHATPGRVDGLWKTDGTAAGTEKVLDIALSVPPETGRTFNPWFTCASGVLYFAAARGSGGTLYRSDGTAAGTTTIKQPTTNTDSSSPGDLADVAGTLFFTAYSDVYGRELWKTDGTRAGTLLVKDIVPGAASANVRSLTNVGGVLYFVVGHEGEDNGLWRSDGTMAGTSLVKWFPPDSSNNYPAELANVGGALYFIANDGVDGSLWKSDGTAEGTLKLAPASRSSTNYPVNYALLGGTVYFTGTGFGLWKTDGTPEGTVLAVDNIPPGSSKAKYLTEAGGLLYFDLTTPADGLELWRSDGTAAGTLRLSDVAAGVATSRVNQLTNVSGTLFFSGGSYFNQELWKSDGTVAGTALVKDINGENNSSAVNGIFDIRGVAYFAALNDEGYFGLWKSNGTAGGTLLVKPLPADLSGSSFVIFGLGPALDDYRYFEVRRTENATEIWRTDGTTAGTALVPTPAPATSPRAPLTLTLANGRFFQAFTNVAAGLELWVADGPVRQGDYSDEGAIDGADVLAWQRALGSNVPRFTSADGDGSGMIDAADLDVWTARYDGSAAIVAASSSTSAALDAAYAAGDFTALFGPPPARDFRPGRRALRW